MVSKEEFDCDCTDLDKAVACDTNVAIGAQEKRKLEKEKGIDWK